MNDIIELSQVLRGGVVPANENEMKTNVAQTSRTTYQVLKEKGIIKRQLDYALIRLSKFNEFTYHDIMSVCKFLQGSSARILNNMKDLGYAEIKTVENRGVSTVQVLKWTKKGLKEADRINKMRV